MSQQRQHSRLLRSAHLASRSQQCRKRSFLVMTFIFPCRTPKASTADKLSVVGTLLREENPCACCSIGTGANLVEIRWLLVGEGIFCTVGERHNTSETNSIQIRLFRHVSSRKRHMSTHPGVHELPVNASSDGINLWNFPENLRFCFPIFAKRRSVQHRRCMSKSAAGSYIATYTHVDRLCHQGSCPHRGASDKLG